MVQLAEKLNIHLLMCTESFNYFCTSSSGEKVLSHLSHSNYNYYSDICLVKAPCYWDQSYYNIANGGFLTKPSGMDCMRCSYLREAILFSFSVFRFFY